LDDIWSSIGYSEEDRSQILDQFLIDIDSLCLQKLELEQKAREDIKNDIGSVKEEIEEISRRMGQESPEVRMKLMCFIFGFEICFVFSLTTFMKSRLSLSSYLLSRM